MNKKLLIVIAVAVVLVGGYFFFGGNNQGAQESSDKDMTSEDTAREISMVSGNLFFNPKNLTLTKGQPVKIAFTNSGVHTFTIDELGVNTALRGNSGVVEFTPTISGTFEYYCAVPGHRGGGMFGTLTVE